LIRLARHDVRGLLLLLLVPLVLTVSCLLMSHLMAMHLVLIELVMLLLLLRWCSVVQLGNVKLLVTERRRMKCLKRFNRKLSHQAISEEKKSFKTAVSLRASKLSYRSTQQWKQTKGR
jgi:hypothetical protein